MPLISLFFKLDVYERETVLAIEAMWAPEFYSTPAQNLNFFSELKSNLFYMF